MSFSKYCGFLEVTSFTRIVRRHFALLLMKKTIDPELERRGKASFFLKFLEYIIKQFLTVQLVFAYYSSSFHS